MVIAYLSAGFLILTDFFTLNISKEHKWLIGLVLVFYGIFRGVRFYTSKK